MLKISDIKDIACDQIEQCVEQLRQATEAGTCLYWFQRISVEAALFTSKAREAIEAGNRVPAGENEAEQEAPDGQ